MIKNIVLTALVCGLSVIAFAKTTVVPVEIDTVLTDDNATYTVTSDENNVHVTVSTTDEKTMMSMLRLGVTVFFDVKGKKKKNVYVKYPSESLFPQRPQRRRDASEQSQQREATSFEEDEAKWKKRITDILEKDYAQNAEYSYFGEAEEFHILMNTLNISAAFTFDAARSTLVYDLILPKSKINTDTKKDLSKLTIGITTTKAERENNKGEDVRANLGGISLGRQQGGGRSRGGGQGGRSGGGQGGSNGQGGGRNGGQGGPQKGQQERASEVLLAYWVKAAI